MAEEELVQEIQKIPEPVHQAADVTVKNREHIELCKPIADKVFNEIVKGLESVGVSDPRSRAYLLDCVKQYGSTMFYLGKATAGIEIGKE